MKVAMQVVTQHLGILAVGLYQYDVSQKSSNRASTDLGLLASAGAACFISLLRCPGTSASLRFNRAALCHAEAA